MEVLMEAELGMDVVIELKPISTNRIYKGKRYLSAEARKFKEDARMYLRQCFQEYNIPAGDLHVYYRFGVSRKMDVDNCVKLFQDVLCDYLGIDDSRIRAVTAIRDKVSIRSEFIGFKILPFKDIVI